MTDDGKITYELDVEGAQEAARKLLRFTKSLEKVGKEGKKTQSAFAEMKEAWKNLTTPINQTIEVVQKAIAGFQAAAAAALEFARRSEFISAQYDMLSGAILEAEKRSGGLATQLQLVEARNRALSQRLQLTETDFANVTVAAIEYSRTHGETIPQSLERFVDALSDPGEELRQLGIRISDGTSESERLKTALQQLDSRLGKTSAQTNTSTGSVIRFATELEDAKNEMTRVVGEGRGLQTFLESLDGALQRVTGRTESLRQEFSRLGSVIDATFGTLGERIEGMTQAADDIRSGRAEGLVPVAAEFLPGSVATVLNAADLGTRFDRNFQQSRAGAAARASQTLAQAGRRVFSASAATAVGEERESDSGVGAAEAVARQQRLDRALAEAENLALLENKADGPRASGGGQAARDRRQAELDMRLELAMKEAETLAQLADQRDERERASHQLRLDLAMKEAETLTQLADERMEREQAAAEMRLELAMKEAQTLSDQETAADAAIRKLEADASSILQPVISGLTDALANVLAGEKSAGEAFQGLLSSFLAMMSQRAAIEAAAQFAAAIGAAASFNYVSAGQHVAAGVAWTGVAVAAGGAAIATAPNVSQPADSGGAGQAAGVTGEPLTLVVNLNAGLVTGSTTEDFGEELGSAIDFATRRRGGILG